MARILIVYGTTEGHTRTIVQRIAEAVRMRGHQADVVDASDVPEDLGLNAYDAFILGGSVHMGKHQSALSHFAASHAALLNDHPSAFFSVSMSVTQPEPEHQEEARGYIREFCEQTGWTPGETEMIAGALLYTEYDFFKRFIMKMIARKSGNPTDTSKDYVFTDWSKIGPFVDRVLAQLTAAVEAVADPAQS